VPPRRLRVRRPRFGHRVTVLTSEKLPIYLNDHLAGATVGVELAKRTRANNQGTELGEFLDRLVNEIAADRETLKSLMRELGVRPDPVKTHGAWVAEKVGRLKLNGQLTGYSPLSRLVELEALAMGVNGKRAMWAALEHAIAARVPEFDFAELGRRAERQATEIEDHRLAAAEVALGSA
jgi:hypothetical protein